MVKKFAGIEGNVEFEASPDASEILAHDSAEGLELSSALKRLIKRLGGGILPP